MKTALSRTLCGTPQRSKCWFTKSCVRRACAKSRQCSKLVKLKAEWKRLLENNPWEITGDYIQEVITAMDGHPRRGASRAASRLQTPCASTSRRRRGDSRRPWRRFSRTICCSRAGLKTRTAPSAWYSLRGSHGRSARRCWLKRCRNGCHDEHCGLIRIDMSEYGENTTWRA